MKILALQKQVTEEAAMKIAEKKGGPLGRLFLRNTSIMMKLMYLESKEIIYDMTYEPVPFFGKLLPARPGAQRQKIRIIVEGTRCNPAYLAEELRTITLDIADESLIQESPHPVQKMIEEGKYLARRMVRRQIGRNVCMEAASVRSIYRPYYVAFYGDWQPENKVRYLAIPADGNEISKMF